MAIRTNETMKFLVNVVYDKEYPGYVVDVPQLPGCMSQGKTVEMALKNARKAIRLYLERNPHGLHLTSLPGIWGSKQSTHPLPEGRGSDRTAPSISCS